VNTCKSKDTGGGAWKSEPPIRALTPGNAGRAQGWRFETACDRYTARHREDSVRGNSFQRASIGRCAGALGASTSATGVPRKRAPGVDGFLRPSIGDDSNWEPDGVTLQVRFCEEPGTNCRMAEIVWHRRETRRQQRTPTSAYPVVRTRLTPRIFNPWPRRVSAAHSTADPDRRGTSDYNGSQSANQHRGPPLLVTEGR